MEKILFNISFILYCISAIMYIIYLFTKKENIAKFALSIIIIGTILQIISFGIRTYYARLIPEHKWYVPMSNMFETLSFFALIIVITFLIIELKYNLMILGSFIIPIACLIMLGAMFTEKNIPKLMPALQSIWLFPHVTVTFISYTCFAISFGIGIAFLIQEHQIKSKKPGDISYKLPSLEILDNLVYRTIAFGFPFLTLGIILGSVWANETWGSYWSWDPKETWALITWFIYLIFLHMRLIRSWRGKKTVYLSLIGFIAVIFTYVGVNYILSGLHSYLG